MITIIVLLILAGVTINAVVGENGIANRAKDAKNQTVVGTEKENIGLAYSACQADTLLEGNVTAKMLKEELQKIEKNTEVIKIGSDLFIKYTNTGNEYKITQDGEILEFETDMIISGVEIYAKLYSYNDGSGALLELSSNPDYESEEEGVTLIEDYGMFGNVAYEYREIMPPWMILKGSFYKDENQIIKVRIIDEIKPKNVACWFVDLDNLVEIENISNINTSEVTDKWI